MNKLIMAAVFTMIATLAQADPTLTVTKDSSKQDIQQVSTTQASAPPYLGNDQEICANLSEKGIQGQSGCCSWHEWL